MVIGYVLDDTLDRSDGVQQAVITTGEHMRSLGHDVHYIVAHSERTDLKNVHSITRFQSFSFNGNSVRTPRPASNKRIAQLFSEVDFDVLHVQMPFSPVLAGRVLRAAPARVRTVGTFHILPYGRLAAWGTRALGAWTRRTAMRIDTLYAVSAPALAFMQSTYSISSDGAVLPNPIDYAFFSDYNRIPTEKKRIVYIGRFEERKGVLELVHAYAALTGELRERAELIMCGKGPLHKEVTETAMRLGVEVQLPGFVSEREKAQHLANADIAVFPSLSGESFGIVLAEAMASGAGVTIGGSNPGYASVLHSWPETLFDPRSQPAFTTTLGHFLSHPEEAHVIGALQHKAVKQYDIRAIADRLLNEAYGG